MAPPKHPRVPHAAGGSPRATSAFPKSTARSPSRTAPASGANCSRSPAPATSSPSATWTRATGQPTSPAAPRYGYTLLSVIMISNLMAILLQALAGAARHRQRPRPRPGLPRQLLAAGHHRALAALRDRHRRVRPRRSDRRGHRPQPAVRPAADLGRLPDRARRARRALPAAPRLPLRRSAGRRADRR